MAAQRRRREATTALVGELRSLQQVLQAKVAQRVELKKALEGLLDALATNTTIPRSPSVPRALGESPTAQRRGAATPPGALVVMTLNLQYYSSYPDDRNAAAKKLREATGGPVPPDIICVQEGLAGQDVLSAAGYELAICAGKEGQAQTVHDMVYGDPGTLRCCKEALQQELLCNQIYLRRGSSWQVEDKGVQRVSSELYLAGGGSRAQGPLAVRSMAWVRVRQLGSAGPAALVMCTHITGGRFEDQYFVQQLATERRRQVERCVAFFDHERPRPLPDDVGILVGDFNATREYAMDGPMHGYFKSMIATSAGVEADAQAAKVHGEELEQSFQTYMTSPFSALDELGWNFAYGAEVGITSGFGHLIDHMASSRPVAVESAEVVYLTNQKMGGRKPDTDLPLTDHNAVKVLFKLQAESRSS